MAKDKSVDARPPSFLCRHKREAKAREFPRHFWIAADQARNTIVRRLVRLLKAAGAIHKEWPEEPHVRRHGTHDNALQ